MPDEVVEILTGAATESILFATILTLVVFGIIYVRSMSPVWIKKMELAAESEKAQFQLEQDRVQADRALADSVSRLGDKLTADQEQQLQTQQSSNLLLGSIQALNESIAQMMEGQRNSWKDISDRMTGITTNHIQKLDTVIKKQDAIQSNSDALHEFLKGMEARLAETIVKTGNTDAIMAQVNALKQTVDIWVQSTAEKMKKFEEIQKHGVE